MEPDQGSAGGSESGASVIESINDASGVGGLEQVSSISGRSSAYETTTAASGRTPAREMSEEAMQFDLADGGSGGVGPAAAPNASGPESYGQKLHQLRLRILDQLLGYVPQMRDIGGVSYKKKSPLFKFVVTFVSLFFSGSLHTIHAGSPDVDDRFGVD